MVTIQRIETSVMERDFKTREETHKGPRTIGEARVRGDVCEWRAEPTDGVAERIQMLAFAALQKAFGDRYLYAGLGTTVGVGTNPRAESDRGTATYSLDESDVRIYRMLLARSDDLNDAPYAKILLVEAKSSSFTDLLKAVDVAVKSGASAFSARRSAFHTSRPRTGADWATATASPSRRTTSACSQTRS